MQPKFEGGINIAIKIPKRTYDSTVAFYRDVLQLPTREIQLTNPTVTRSHEVIFGPNKLWLDCVDNYTRTETWLELKVASMAEAVAHLVQHGTPTCDEIEAIPPEMHWIADPSGSILLLKQSM